MAHGACAFMHHNTSTSIMYNAYEYESKGHMPYFHFVIVDHAQKRDYGPLFELAYTCTCMCIYMYMYVYVYLYIHVHVHVHVRHLTVHTQDSVLYSNVESAAVCGGVSVSLYWNSLYVCYQAVESVVLGHVVL